MRNPADTYELRRMFAHEFMTVWMSDIDPSETTMADMLDVFYDDMQEAATQHDGVDADGARDDALEWLGDRGYDLAGRKKWNGSVN